MEAGRLVSRDCISRYVITHLYFVVRESGAVVVLCVIRRAEPKAPPTTHARLRSGREPREGTATVARRHSAGQGATRSTVQYGMYAGQMRGSLHQDLSQVHFYL